LIFTITMEEYYQAEKNDSLPSISPARAAQSSYRRSVGETFVGRTCGVRQVTFGESADAQVRILSSESLAAATQVNLSVGGASVQLRSSLAGALTRIILAALAAGAQALSRLTWKSSANVFPAMQTVPGRMQRVDLGADSRCSSITPHPDALYNVLASAARSPGSGCSAFSAAAATATDQAPAHGKGRGAPLRRGRHYLRQSAQRKTPRPSFSTSFRAFPGFSARGHC